MLPRTEADVAEIVRGRTEPVRIEGGGTKTLEPPTAAEVLSTTELSGIVRYDPESLTLVVRAGTAVKEIEDSLAGARQRLGFEPPDWRALMGLGGEATIGGVIAANHSGPRRVQGASARDHLLGVRFVDGTGEVVRNGGRTLKNVTGYDLVRLVSGSRGSLGILTEVAVKVQPDTDQATVCLSDIAPDASVAAMTAALGSPFDVSGAAWLPGEGCLIRVEGLAGSVAYRSGKLAALLSVHGPARIERDPERGRTVWDAVGGVRPFAGKRGDVWRFSVPPGDAPGLVARLRAEVMLDWGGGLVWALVPPGTDARALARPYRGHATLVRAAPETKARLAVFEQMGPVPARLADGIRRRFDPKGLFSTP
jgi:glycolate oxidase FAD binding subunit